MNKKYLILIIIIILFFGCSKKVEINYVVDNEKNFVNKLIPLFYHRNGNKMSYIENTAYGSDGYKIYSVNKNYNLLNSYKIVEGKGPGEGGYLGLFTYKDKIIWYDQGLNRFNVFNKKLEYQDLININEINLFQGFFKINNKNYAFNITGYDNEMRLEIVKMDFNFKKMKTDFETVNDIYIGEMGLNNYLIGKSNKYVLIYMKNSAYYFDKNDFSMVRKVKLHKENKNVFTGNMARFIDIINDDIFFYFEDDYYFYDFDKDEILDVKKITLNSNKKYKIDRFFFYFFGKKMMMYWTKERDKVIVRNVKGVEVK